MQQTYKGVKCALLSRGFHPEIFLRYAKYEFKMSHIKLEISTKRRKRNPLRKRVSLMEIQNLLISRKII